MSTRQLIKTLLLLILFPLSSIAQESMGIPPSPTVASLVSVKKNAVNNSGNYVHNIPIWNINLKDHSFPIELTYSSSGVKVEEIPSYTGTGWNLSAGGVVTRSVMDLPDDYTTVDGKGILHTNLLNEIETLNNTTETQGYNEATSSNFFKNTVNNNYLGIRNDTQPDLFYFSFFGKSGKFVFNKNKEIISLSNDNFKFSYTLDSNDNLETFTVVDTDGTSYVFAERELTQSHYNSASQWEFLSARSKRQLQIDFYSSWHLTNVVTVNGLTMHLEYSDETLTYTIKDSEMGKICGDQQCEDATADPSYDYDILNNSGAATTDYVINSKKIQKITSNFFSIAFNNTSRQDLNGGNKLNQIEIKDANLNTIKKYNFQYSYFLSPNMPSTNNFEYKRLKLDAVSVNDEFYQEFEYYTDYNLPHRTSTEQDFWGYFNDNNSTSLVPKAYVTLNGNFPKYHIFPPVNESVVYEYGSVDRNVNASTVHMGLLKKIKFKTDGHKEFFYEPNDFTMSTYTSGNTTKKGNGVRVKRVEYFDGLNTENSYYHYTSPLTGVSSGKISYLPKFATHIPWNFTFRYHNTFGTSFASPATYSTGIKYYSEQGDCYLDESQNPPVYTCPPGNICARYPSSTSIVNLGFSPSNQPQKYFAMTTRRFSSSQIPLASNIETPLIYEYVTIKEGDNGEKRYNYNILGALDTPIPNNFDLDKFLHKPSYKTYYWKSDLDSDQGQNDITTCEQVIPPVGTFTLSDFNDYYAYMNISGESHPYAPKPNWNKYFGQLINYTYLNEEGFKVYKEDYEYDLKGNLTDNNTDKKIISLKYRLFDRPIGFGVDTYNNVTTGPTAWVWSFYNIYYGIGLVPTSTTKTSYYNNETISFAETNNSTYTYGNLLQDNSYTDSKGDTMTSNYKYPLDFQSVSQNNTPNIYKVMTDKNILYNPIETIQKNNNTIISAQINEYTLDNTIVVYKTGYQLETTDSNYNYTLASVANNTNTGVLNKDAKMVEKFSNDAFGVYGNVLQSTSKNDLPITTVWGYNNALLIARIETIPYNQLDTWFQNDYNKPLSYLNTITTPNLLNAWLTNLRQTVANRAGQIMTFTYTPFHAINSITGIDGKINTYEYDNFNRLLNIKDQYGNIVSEYEYNYKNEN